MANASSWRMRSLPVTLATAASLFGCQSCPQKFDTDVEPSPLPLHGWSPQQLHCRENDCADSYSIEVPERGDLSVEAATSGETSVARPFTLQLQRAGEALAVAQNAGTGSAGLSWQADAGVYLVVVSSRTDRERSPLRYEIQARFEPEPPPPPPPPPPDERLEKVSSEVLEVEGRPGAPEAVMIDRGADAGLRSGLSGRLVDAGREIATIEIEETFETGSRARITSTLRGVITPATVAEIDVPLEAP